MKRRTLTYDDPQKLERECLLRKVDFMTSAGDDFISEAQYHLTEENFKKNEVIIRNGDSCPSVLMVIEGSIQISVTDPSDNPRELDKLKAGDVIGQYSMISNTAVNYDAKAMTPVKLLALPYNFFTENKDIIPETGDIMSEAEEVIKK
mmetsp:Transcript_36494/g.56029  ORF Transcript_36494/g.56029 Transcript_36494/m.56029 type:complete len:148 (-) Transcript_36494:851-1294(-)